MRDDGDLFDAEVAEANRIEMDRASPTSPVTFPHGAEAERESKVRHALGGPPYFLSSDEVDLWLDKHSSVKVLGAIAILDRREQRGQVIDSKVAYLEGILSDAKRGNRGKRGRGEPAASHGIEWHRERVRRDADAAAAAGYPQRPGYADDVIQGQQLARQIGAMAEGSERDALIGEWKNLP